MEKTVIKLKNVYKSYYLSNNEEISVLNGINFEIKQGEFVAIMGESWWWKSTLLNILWCWHPLSSWEYFLENEDIGHIKDDFTLAYIRNQKMWFVFQSFNLLWKLSALKNVALPSLYKWLTKREREEKASLLLDQVWLPDRKNHKPSELSWWQQQRVSIARSLINNPEIILADEPTWALDSKTWIEIMDIFIDLKKNQNKTIIMVTHTADVAKYADRIIFLKDWKVVSDNYKLA